MFTDRNLKQPKAKAAAEKAIKMNPLLKNHIDWRLDKVHEGTLSIYSESAFKKMDLVANALDNVKARLFIDEQCIKSRTPFVDSGTVGEKGHVQTILPFETENYAAKLDAEDNLEIPHCTLKMFPEETLHCIEWAKEMFANKFTLNPQNYNKLKQSKQEDIEFGEGEE